MGLIADGFDSIRSIKFRDLLTQVITLGMIFSSALIIWKGLMLVSGSESPVVVVLSESMEPGFQRGDILFLHMKKDPIRAGEIVVYNVDGREIPIVHRVIEVREQHGTKEVNILTKGDNNEMDDRMLYVPGQFWLQRQHIMGKAIGFLLFVLTRDAHISIVNSITGDIISSMTLPHPKKECSAISMLVIGTTSTFKTKNHNSDKLSKDISSDSLLLLCCDNSLSLYSLESVIKGNNDCICEVNLLKPCCWSTAIKLKDVEAYCVILLYQTGILEMRSLPKLEVIGENSLMSILRWPFKIGMDKTLGSSENGEISLVYGCEMALLGVSSEWRIRTSRLEHPSEDFCSSPYILDASMALNFSDQKYLSLLSPACLA